MLSLSNGVIISLNTQKYSSPSNLVGREPDEKDTLICDQQELNLR